MITGLITEILNNYFYTSQLGRKLPVSLRVPVTLVYKKVSKNNTTLLPRDLFFRIWYLKINIELMALYLDLKNKLMISN